MKINKLVLKNFRSYEEKTVFDFTTTNDKNIILVGGKNGAGKSTIFEAIKVCIYGPIAYKYQGFNSSYISSSSCISKIPYLGLLIVLVFITHHYLSSLHFLCH